MTTQTQPIQRAPRMALVQRYPLTLFFAAVIGIDWLLSLAAAYDATLFLPIVLAMSYVPALAAWLMLLGMLRAIGYHAGMVAFSFVLEASFIALTGIFIGAAAGLILGQNIVATFFTGLTPTAQSALPWLQIGLILLLAYGFSLLTTILPAVQAARIYPAEALRYE